MVERNQVAGAVVADVDHAIERHTKSLRVRALAGQCIEGGAEICIRLCPQILQASDPARVGLGINTPHERQSFQRGRAESVAYCFEGYALRGRCQMRIRSRGQVPHLEVSAHAPAEYFSLEAVCVEIAVLQHYFALQTADLSCGLGCARCHLGAAQLAIRVNVLKK